jgi:hypothetical protein
MHLSRIKTAILATLIVCLWVIQRSEGAGSGQTEEEKILQVQKEMTKASLDGNATGFVKHLADGYTSTQANGTVLSREEVRKRRTSGKMGRRGGRPSLTLTLPANLAVLVFKLA